MGVTPSTGPVRREHRDAANATMVDSDDVLLLRGPGSPADPRTREGVATVCHPSGAAPFDAYAARHLSPAHAVHRTEHAANDYPLLPVRTGADVRVWFGPGATALAGAAAAARTGGGPAGPVTASAGVKSGHPHRPFLSTIHGDHPPRRFTAAIRRNMYRIALYSRFDGNMGHWSSPGS
ncbi:hypothetical protein P8A21_32700 [Streptomyces poriferorum]|uniref:hypothetical protein n=1 Tax=Streptomyces poriferorum TaxID=2798799 RepID=UPI00273F7A61|nr:hypothetical protein [Streptomyces sp. Alt1]WLQ51964.1 hypothetical protein P8A21_32700 [Streptomyces sp. Alt1]